MLTFRDSGWNERYYGGKSSEFIAENVPEEFVQQAKDIDGENYCESCFQVQIIWNEDDNEIHIGSEKVYGSVGKFGELFYVDVDGNWICMDYRLSEAKYSEVIKLFNEVWSEE